MASIVEQTTTGQATAQANSQASAEDVDVLARLFEPDVLDDPSPFYAWLREHLPVHRHRSGPYYTCRHADVRWMFQAPLLTAPEPAELATRFPRLYRHQSFRYLAGTVAMTNPPVHTRLRRLVTRDFTLKTVNNLRPRMESVVDGLLDRLAEPLRDGEVVDLHAGLTRPFAQSVIAELVGIDPADRPALTPLVTTVLYSTNPASTDEMLDAADEASAQVAEYYERLLPVRRERPRGDLISALVAAHDDDDDRLTQDELMCWLWGLWAGGFETTSAGMDNAAVILLRRPDQAHWVRGKPDEVKAFVNECLRYQPPSVFNGVARIARQDIELSGVTIPEGSDVRGLPGCANRDPSAFPDPDRFDPSRDTSTMVSFGHGMHYCLGANLARVEMGVLLPRLHARFPTLALAEPPVRRLSPPLLAFDRIGVALEKR
jgi:cytochrome P450 family 114